MVKQSDKTTKPFCPTSARHTLEVKCPIVFTEGETIEEGEDGKVEEEGFFCINNNDQRFAWLHT